MRRLDGQRVALRTGGPVSAGPVTPQLDLGFATAPKTGPDREPGRPGQTGLI